METKPGDLAGLAETSASTLKTEAEKESSTVTASTSKPADPAPEATVSAPIESVPDPDEDDLDDLDDMLDEFTPSKPEPKAPSTSKPSTSGPGRPPFPPESFTDEGISDEDFAKQLQAGMADLLGELETSPDMQAQFENMLKELGGAAALGEAAGLDIPGPSSSSSPKPTSKAVPEKEEEAKKEEGIGAGLPSEESFQETIKKTMERMRASGDSATAAATSEPTDDILAEMMKAMSASGLDGAEGSEEDFSKMLLGMMEQLTNKEILYEPMKELDDKFPAWMEKNEGKVGEGDMKRYKEQQVYVREIVGRFEGKGYSDDNAPDREYIVERMQKVCDLISSLESEKSANAVEQMQAAGSPPPDLVGDMAAAQEAFGAPEEGCPQQ
ncbi:Pex19 protein family-domain-containing protein [Halenospora varia]|nr:Pex19 protein family-domain-containing protein [Halenospora varia]